MEQLAAAAVRERDQEFLSRLARMGDVLKSDGGTGWALGTII